MYDSDDFPEGFTEYHPWLKEVVNVAKKDCICKQCLDQYAAEHELLNEMPYEDLVLEDNEIPY